MFSSTCVCPYKARRPKNPYTAVDLPFFPVNFTWFYVFIMRRSTRNSTSNESYPAH